MIPIDGESARKIKTGDSFRIAAGKTHDFSNTGIKPLKLHAWMSSEKGSRFLPNAP